MDVAWTRCGTLHTDVPLPQHLHISIWHRRRGPKNAKYHFPESRINVTITSLAKKPIFYDTGIAFTEDEVASFQLLDSVPSPSIQLLYMIGRLQKHLAWIEIINVTNESVYCLEILLKHA